MGKEIVVSIVGVAFFTAIVLTVYFVMKYRSILPPPLPGEGLRNQRKSDWQKPGIVLLGIGLGIVVVGIMKSIKLVYIQGSASIGVIVIFTGVSMIIAQALDKKKSTED